MSTVDKTPLSDHHCNDVCIIVVVFNPSIDEFLENLSSYTNQVGRVIICDNSDKLSIRRQILRIVEIESNLTYLPMTENIGIAAAQNRGINFGISLGFEYFIELDQDSKLPSRFVVNIFESYKLLIASGHTVAGIGPLAMTSSGFVYDGQMFDSRIIKVDKTLSSGFFFSRAAYQLVGPKEESLFIDYVDWEWCWRAANIGLSTYINRTVAITHMLGDGHRRLLGFYIGIPSPIRHYYQYRNALYMLRRRYVPMSWRLKRIVIMLVKTPIYAYFVGDGEERRKYILKGIVDAYKNNVGKIIP